jgi:hypothetical protein
VNSGVVGDSFSQSLLLLAFMLLLASNTLLAEQLLLVSMLLLAASPAVTCPHAEGCVPNVAVVFTTLSCLFCIY